MRGLGGFYGFDVYISTTLFEREMGKSRDNSTEKLPVKIVGSHFFGVIFSAGW